MKKLLAIACLLTSASLVGCNAKDLASAIGAAKTVTGSTAPGAGSKATKYRLSGTVYAPQTQVAIISGGAGNIISGGAGNYMTLARSDEKGLSAGKVKLMGLVGETATATAQTDTSGKFSVEVPGGTTYKVEVTATTKDDATITITGLALVGADAATFELDVAHHLVAGKLLNAGATMKGVTKAQLDEVVSLARTELEKVAQTPEPTDASSAASEFDKFASAALKAKVQVLIDLK